MKLISEVKVERIFSLLPDNVKRQTNYTDLKELDASRDLDLTRKRFYRLKKSNLYDLHITYGYNLDEVYRNSKSFHKSYPQLSCKPIFLSGEGEIKLFGQEFFTGIPIDEAYSDGFINENDTGAILEQINKIFNEKITDSSKKNQLEEFNRFKKEVLLNQKLHTLDRSFLKLYVFKIIEKFLFIKPPSIRWSSGDLSARNILVNTKQKTFRIIDCEFSSYTHFHEEDWFRLTIFCNEKFRKSKSLEKLLNNLNPLWETFLVLKQILLNKYIHKSDDYARHVTNDLIRSIFTANSKTNQQDFKKPLIADGLLNMQNHFLNLLSIENQKIKSLEKISVIEYQKLCDLQKEIFREQNKYKVIIKEKDNLQSSLDSTQSELNETKNEIIYFKDQLRSKDILIKNEKNKYDTLKSNFNDLLLKNNQLIKKIKHYHQSIEIRDVDLQKANECISEKTKKLLSLEFAHNKANKIIQEKILTISEIKEQKLIINNELLSIKKYNSQNLTKIKELEYDLKSSKNILNISQDKIIRMQNSFSWRITSFLRLLRRITLDRFLPKKLQNTILVCNRSPDNDYNDWISNFDLSSKSYQLKIANEAKNFVKNPKISIIMPVYKPNIEHLSCAIDSVIQQTYTYWELCIADDFSNDPDVVATLNKIKSANKKIKVIFLNQNTHISGCSNVAATQATGDFLAFLDHDDILSPFALHYLAKAINDNDDPILIYSDEDKINENRERFSPYFKPDWNPDLLRSQNYICHLASINTKVFRSLGGFRKGFEGSQDWDLFLRATENACHKRIIHIPKILYHWRVTSESTAQNLDNKCYSLDSAEKALAAHHIRLKSGGAPERLLNGYFKTNYVLSKSLKSTIIIPTRNGGIVLERCLRSIYKLTDTNLFELIIINNGSDCTQTLELLSYYNSEYANLRILNDNSSFNFSALNNNAVKEARNDIIVFLNDDTEIIANNWLIDLMSNAVRKEAGAVGAKLLYPNGTIQHAGVVLGVGGVAGHAFKNLPENTSIQMNRANIQQFFSAVTAACLAVEKSKFELVNGFDERYLRVAFNDVDLCLKLLDNGFYNIYLPHVVLKHYESYSRGYEDSTEKKERFQKEVSIVKKRWGHLLSTDPNYSPNFSLNSEKFDYREQM